MPQESPIFQADIHESKSWLLNVIQRQLPEPARNWVHTHIQSLEQKFIRSKFHLAFGSTPRRVGKAIFQVTDEELLAAQALRPGLRPDTWTVDQATRILFLLLLPHNTAEAHYEAVFDVFDTADMGEQAALFASFPLLPFPSQYKALAAEGIRTNMTVVLEAIALHNPYPAEFLEENAWNQLFLKCTFTDRPLYKIHGINLRENQELARIISDYAHERWAAGREVTPEIWCPVGPYFSESHLSDCQRLLEHTLPIQQEAAALLCVEAGTSQSVKLVSSYPELKARVIKGEISWEDIGKRWEVEKLSIVNT